MLTVICLLLLTLVSWVASAPTVRPTSQPTYFIPAIPRVISATFASDGSSIIVEFDSNVDASSVLGSKSSFTCGVVFTFPGASSTSVCQFVGPRTALAFLNGASVVTVTDYLSIQGGTIRAECPKNIPLFICDSFEGIPAGSVPISAPSSVTVPAVILPATMVASICAPPVIDLSMSYGSGGRFWSSVVVNVVSGSSTANDLKTFLVGSKFLSEAVAIPTNFLESGFSYTISVTLCNFLGGCGSATTILTVQSEALPYVSILGNQLVTSSVFNSLRLDATASLPLCGNRLVPVSQLGFNWTVTQGGILVPNVQRSRDKTRFLSDPYAFVAGLSYVVTCTVFNMERTSQKSSASVTVNVARGSVIANIAGSGTRLVPFDGSIFLDGSASFDQNIGPNARNNLAFSWTCAQTAPTALPSCPSLALTGSNTQRLSVRNIQTEYAAYAFVFTLTVSDVSDLSRVASTSVTGSLLTPAAPLVTLTNPAGSGKMNPQGSLRLDGVVTLSSTETMTWSVDDRLINLGNLMLTPPTRVLAPGVQSVSLVLPPNALFRGTTYVFTLTCGITQASVRVVVNDPPRPGAFTISPTDGIEMTDPFRFATNFWTDEDTPMTFEFGFLSSRGTRLVLQPRSRLTSVTTSLPAGQDVNGFMLTVYVLVYDVLNAVQEMTITVKVRPAPSTSALLNGLSSTITGAGTVGDLKQALSLVTSVINNKNCTMAPNCDSLNRASCTSTRDTCGTCLPGYYGDIGHQNSKCVDGLMLSNIQENANTVLSCSDTYDCLDWHTCSSGVCVPTSKSCISPDCSGNGQCEFVHSGTGFFMRSCPMYDFNCVAQCTCRDGFYGADCSTPNEEFEKRLGIRSQVLDGLVQLTESDNPSADSARSLISSLSAATDQAEEIASDATNQVLDIANGILASNYLGQLSTQELSGLLSSLDALLLGAAGGARRKRRALAETISLRTSVVASLDEYGLVIGDEHLVAGQLAETKILKLFRTSYQKFGAGSGFTASLPTDNTDFAMGKIGSSVSLDEQDADSEMLLVLTSISSSLYSEVETPLNSDALRVVARAANVTKNVTIVIEHNQDIDFPINPSNVTFVTECTKTVRVVDFVCPDNYVIVHRCNGSLLTLTSRCPGLKTVSRCQSVEALDSIKSCEVVSFTPKSTTCSCRITPSGTRRVRRGLAVEDSDIGYIEVAAMSEVVAEDFAGTIYSARKFDSLADLQRVFTIVVMFSVMWVLGLALTWYFNMRGATKDRKTEMNEALSRQRQEASVGSKVSVDRIKKFLDAYVTEVFPVVFRPSPWHERLITEIKKHHRYLNIITGARDSRQRFMTTAHLLTIQTMLMFILAVFYDLQFPSDDGSCGKLDYSSCEDEKSIFDSAKSKCNWNEENESCDFVNPRISEQIIVLISIVVACATAPINLVVDFMFDDVLSAPTADSVKLSAEPTAIQRVGKQVNAARRASVNAVRRASVSIQNAIGPAAPQRRTSSKLLQTSTTRLIPESTKSAQTLAIASAADAMAVFRDAQGKYEEDRNSVLGNMTSKSLINTSRRARETGAPRVTEVRPAIDANSPIFGSSVDARFAELSKEIVAQRRRLKPSEQEDFDLRWGFDPTGEFASGTGRKIAFFGSQDAEEKIKSELVHVQKEVAEKYEKLRLASDSHTGLEMLHLFVLDLLGRNTPAALIFTSKTSEDFRHTMIVSKTAKRFCWALIVVLNALFIFFAMLRGLERGSEWQMGYAMACVIQFLVEIVMFETIECIWVHYLIPDAASGEIYAAQHSLKRTISSLCSAVTPSSTYILDAPRYLFVSTNLAEKFPDMLESMIIRSYHHHLPGEIGRKWRVSHNDRDSAIFRFVKNFSVFAVTISILQWVGSSPASLQRAVIHTVNPLLFGGIFIVLLLLYRNPIYLTVIAGLVLYKLLHYAWKEFMKYRVANRPVKFERMVSNVVPSVAAENPKSRGNSSESQRSVKSINSIAVMPLPVLDVPLNRPYEATKQEEVKQEVSSGSEEEGSNEDDGDASSDGVEMTEKEASKSME